MCQTVRVTAGGRNGDFFSRYNLWQVFLNLVFRLLIENNFKILLSRFVEINGLTFLHVTYFSLQVHDKYKT